MRAWLLSVIIAALVAGCSSAPTPRSDYYPTAGWRTSAPEQQGMDAGKLNALFDTIERDRLNVFNVIIVRHGHIVAEKYYGNNTASTRHNFYSCTKSVTSALVGIAIRNGAIKSIHDNVLSYFPERTVANDDPRKQAITLEQLLSMTSGLRWEEITISYSDTRNSYRSMTASTDWVQYVLDQPMAAQPGKVFEYSTGGSHLLSAVLTRATGKNALDYAREVLLGPLGITDVVWQADPQGNTFGGASLQMTARDAAKIGYLYLRNGMWDGKQLVPADWVRESTRQHSKPDWGGDGYGYQWWLFKQGVYSAMGYGGQYILVAPAQDVVVVFNAELEPPQVGSALLPRLVQELVLPAVVR
jgi:CubicO group peptidase (beta-lactamase class C family)